MQCERCQKNPAIVRIDQVINGQRKAYYLCQSCVDETMSAFNQTKDLTNFAEVISSPPGVVQSQKQDTGDTKQQLKAIDQRLAALEEKLRLLQTASDEETNLLTQILTRLSENPSPGEQNI